MKDMVQLRLFYNSDTHPSNILIYRYNISKFFIKNIDTLQSIDIIFKNHDFWIRSIPIKQAYLSVM